MSDQHNKVINSFKKEEKQIHIDIILSIQSFFFVRKNHLRNSAIPSQKHAIIYGLKALLLGVLLSLVPTSGQ